MGQRPLRVVLAGTLIGILVACGGGGNGDGSDPTGALPGVATIGVAGGTVRSDDGAQVVFPRNALAADVTVRIAKDSTGAPPLPASAVAAGPVYAITPHGGTFEDLVEVSIPVERATQAGDGQLLLVTAEPGDTQWRVLSAASYRDGTMRAPVMHFSFFQTIRLVDVAMPALVTKIDGANNIGGPGTSLLSALQYLPFLTTDPYSNCIGGCPLPINTLVAELSMPSTTAVPLVPSVGITRASSAAACRPVDLAHGAMSFRFRREGSQEFFPAVDHAAVVPRDPWPRFPGDGGPLRFTTNTTIGGSYFPGFGAIHYYGNESPRIFGLYDANPPTQAMRDRADAEQNSTAGRYVLPVGNVYALPPAGDNPADNLYTWNGRIQWSATQNGSVRIDAAIMTTCGLMLEAAPLAFRLAAPASRSQTAMLPVNAAEDGVAEGSDVTLQFGRYDYARNRYLDSDADVTSYRVDFSPDPTRVEWQPVPTAAVTRRTFVTYSSGWVDVAGVEVRLPAVQTSQSGSYRVFWCDDTGCFDSYSYPLAVYRSPPAITAQPTGQTVQVGQTASFTIATTGAPRPSLQWQKRSFLAAAFGFLAWTNIDGATGATYTTPPLALTDTATQYRVWATNAVGSVASDVAMLTVVDQLLPPVIDAQPGNLSVTVGGTAVFAATVSGHGPLSFQWRRNGVNLTGANSPILTLNNVTALNDGRYELVVTNTAGSVTTEPSILQVALGTPVSLAPAIAAPPASITVTEGNAANFAVAVTGTGPYSYQWIKSGASTPLANGDLPSFGIAAVTAADAGDYSVRVTNSVGQALSASARLTVTPGSGVPVAPTITTAPVALAVLPGGGATFAVAVNGTAPISYQWRRNGIDVPGATGAVLHIVAVSALDAGQYVVEARNPAGATSTGGVPLIVIGAPVITQQPVAAGVTAGQAATFNVAASGDGVMYQWTRNNVAIPGATAASYTTPALVLADSGAVFAVVVYNGAGVAFSGSAVLTVSPVPVAAQWQGPLALRGADGFAAANAVVAAGASGQFVSAWLDVHPNGAKELRSSRYLPGTGWSAAVTVAPLANSGSATTALAIAMDPAGNAVVIYTSKSNLRQSLWGSRQGPTGGWSTPELLESQEDGDAELPALAIDSQGTATAAWQQNDTAFFPNLLATRRIVASRSVVGQGWSAPVDIDFTSGGHGTGLPIHVGASPAGNVVVGWTGDSPAGQVASANVYRSGIGWVGAQQLVTDTTPTTATVVGGAAVNDAGLALVTMHRLPSITSNVYAARYTPAAGWSSPELLGANAYAPSAVLAPDGTATLVWENTPGTQILVTRGSAAGTWSTPQVAGAGFSPAIGRDAAGNVTLAWLSNPGVRSVTSARWPVAGVLGSAAVIESDPASASGWVAGGLAVSANGHAAAVWTEGDSQNAAPWANVFR